MTMGQCQNTWNTINYFDYFSRFGQHLMSQLQRYVLIFNRLDKVHYTHFIPNTLSPCRVMH